MKKISFSIDIFFLYIFALNSAFIKTEMMKKKILNIKYSVKIKNQVKVQENILFLSFHRFLLKLKDVLNEKMRKKTATKI